MRQHREVRVIHRHQNPFGLFLLRELEIIVHRADDEIELAEHVVRHVQAAALQDIHLEPLEQRDPVRLIVQLVDLLQMRQQPRDVEPLGDAEMLRVIGDREVLEPPLLRPKRHP